ncbi:hypothetical protein POX_g09285 [Penicillium oxalicum]|uniref:hypothetical protein n=1 Tax=Penicillium oxalicum TaxID=69781 RepID=UPI0020B7A315|nr:hypothetical protein POX_g09285 [Penicillium oxalicum]KAI2786889.1 hypothetical protein POX_g09285 [Penicillium oxalicum]
MNPLSFLRSCHRLNGKYEPLWATIPPGVSVREAPSQSGDAALQSSSLDGLLQISHNFSNGILVLDSDAGTSKGLQCVPSQIYLILFPVGISLSRRREKKKKRHSGLFMALAKNFTHFSVDPSTRISAIYHSRRTCSSPTVTGHRVLID